MATMVQTTNRRVRIIDDTFEPTPLPPVRDIDDDAYDEPRPLRPHKDIIAMAE